MIERTVPFAQAGCVGAKIHRPKPLVSELHHVFPLYLQARVWDDVNPDRPSTAHDTERVALCGNCHSTVHTVITDLVASRQAPPRVAPKLMAIAAEALELYRKAITERA